jgi:predicted amidohydrolase
LARIAACGQNSAHLLHWMQSFVSQTGISAAMSRFSQRAVPVGQVPSGGKALTGSSVAVARQHQRASRAARSRARRPAPAGRACGCGRLLGQRPAARRCASAASSASTLRVTTSGAALAVGLLDALARCARTSSGQDAVRREEARLHHGVDAAAEAGLLGHAEGVDHVELAALGE